MQSSIIINYLSKNVFPFLYDFFMSITFRWIILFTLLFLNIFSFVQNPKLHSNSKKCMKMNCRINTFIIGFISITISLISLIALWYIAPFSNELIDYWYIPIILLIYALIIQITISIKPVIEDGNLNPPPDYLLPKKYRVILYVLLLSVSLIYSLQLYLDGGVNLISNGTKYMDHFVLGRFGGITKNKYMFFVEWITIVRIIFGILNIRNISDFYACDYELPSSWDY